MKQTKRLVRELETLYGNHHIGLASQVGYLTGVLKAMESEVKGASKFIEDHTDWLGNENKNNS